MIEKIIRKKIKEYRQEIIDTLCSLISIPTVNPPGHSYRQCIYYLFKILTKWGIDNCIITSPDEDYTRFSLIGSYGKGKNSLHFHGHYDVVPANAQRQFYPRVNKTRIYGRGSSDMKSGLIAMLFAIRVIKECGVKLKGKINFSIVPDEETGGELGTKYLMESKFLPLSNLGMLMPEPTSGAVWNANKGALTCRITIKGKSAHVGLQHQGVNAFEHMVKIANSFLELKNDIQKRKTSLKINPPEAKHSVILIGGESGSGDNFNIVPEKAFFTIDRRINPEEKLVEVKNELIQVLEKHKREGMEIEIKVLQEGESSIANTDSPLAITLKKIITQITGKSPDFTLCPGLCEIRFFNNQGIPAYAYGPGLLEVSHGPNEYVHINDILNCTLIYALTAVRLLT